MGLNPEEISSIIRRQIKDYEIDGTVRSRINGLKKELSKMI